LCAAPTFVARGTPVVVSAEGVFGVTGREAVFHRGFLQKWGLFIMPWQMPACIPLNMVEDSGVLHHYVCSD
jgi:hypothetical protein